MVLIARRKEAKGSGETDVQYVDKQRGIAVVLDGDGDLKGGHCRISWTRGEVLPAHISLL